MKPFCLVLKTFSVLSEVDEVLVLDRTEYVKLSYLQATCAPISLWIDVTPPMRLMNTSPDS